MLQELLAHWDLDLPAVLESEAVRGSASVERLDGGDVAVPPEHVLAEDHVGEGGGEAGGRLYGQPDRDGAREI